MFDAIVIGSGPAGVFTAYQLRPLKVLMLDVGYEAGETRLPPENLYKLRKQGVDLTDKLIGEKFESLNNLDHRYVSPKLKGPLWEFLSRRPAMLPEDIERNFESVMSFAKGGLANGWGAGVLRFNDRDLEGFPFEARELERFYNELTRHIGVNGTVDDLSSYFGSTADLQTPLPLSPASEDLLHRYGKKRAQLKARGFTIGRTRAAILTADHGSRKAYQPHGQDFFQPNLPSIYHPGYTLDELRSRGEIEYRPGYLVQRFDDHRQSVTVTAKNISTGAIEKFESKKVFLAAGALNSARIALQSRDDHTTKLPLLDNPVSFVPLVNPLRIGAPLPYTKFSGGELIVLYEGSDSKRPVQASFYSLGSPLRSDLLTEFPLSFKGNIAASKYLLPALAMLQIFYPDDPAAENTLSLEPHGALKLSYNRKREYELEGTFIRALRSLGFLATKALCKFPAPGSSIHYAGSLPMKSNPASPYETDSFGKLGFTENVYVTDAANFPRLPSKNHTFTIMANAMRIAEHVKRSLESIQA